VLKTRESKYGNYHPSGWMKKRLVVLITLNKKIIHQLDQVEVDSHKKLINNGRNKRIINKNRIIYLKRTKMICSMWLIIKMIIIIEIKLSTYMKKVYFKIKVHSLLKLILCKMCRSKSKIYIKVNNNMMKMMMTYMDGIRNDIN
jgi:hypothetical protein